jgi:hypothetical protein
MPLLRRCIVQVLLGLWGPIVTSVGSLLTIVLIFLTDVSSFLIFFLATSCTKGCLFLVNIRRWPRNVNFVEFGWL